MQSRMGQRGKKKKKVTNEQQAMLPVKVGSPPGEIMLCKVPWYRKLWTGKVTNEWDDARLDWNCDVWRKGKGIKPGESMGVSKQGRMRQMTKELGAM